MQATGEGAHSGVGRRGSHTINTDIPQADSMQQGEGAHFGVGRRGSHAFNTDIPQADSMQRGEGANFGVGRRGSHAINAEIPQADSLQRWASLEQHDSSDVQQRAAVPKVQKKRSWSGATRDAGLAARKAGKHGYDDTPVAAVSRQHSSDLTATAVGGLGSSTSFAEGSLGVGGNDVEMGMMASSAGAVGSSLGMEGGAAGIAEVLEGMWHGRRVYKLRERRNPRLTQLAEFQDDEVDVMECY